MAHKCRIPQANDSAIGFTFRNNGPGAKLPTLFLLFSPLFLLFSPPFSLPLLSPVKTRSFAETRSGRTQGRKLENARPFIQFAQVNPPAFSRTSSSTLAAPPVAHPATKTAATRSHRWPLQLRQARRRRRCRKATCSTTSSRMRGSTHPWTPRRQSTPQSLRSSRLSPRGTRRPRCRRPRAILPARHSPGSTRRRLMVRHSSSSARGATVCEV